MTAARPLIAPPVENCDGEAMNKSPLGAKRISRTLCTLVKWCTQNPLGKLRKLRLGSWSWPPGTTEMPPSTVRTEPGRSQKRVPGFADGDELGVGEGEIVAGVVGVSDGSVVGVAVGSGGHPISALLTA